MPTQTLPTPEKQHEMILWQLVSVLYRGFDQVKRKTETTTGT
jgi:hypothetical protein